MNEGSKRWSPKKKSTQTRQTEQEEEEKEKKKEREQTIQKEKKMSTNNHLTETIKDTDVIMTDTNTDKSEDVAKDGFKDDVKDDAKDDVKDDAKDDVTATAAEEDNKVQSVIDEDGDVIMKRTTDSSNQITSSIPVSLPNTTSNTTTTNNNNTNNNNTTTTTTTSSSSSSSSSISASINNSSITEAAKETEKKKETEEKEEKEKKDMIKMITVGSIVFVESGTRKNKYRPGGVARVVALNKSQNTPDGSTQIAYNVAYILGGGENYLASRHVSLHHDDSSTNTSSSSSTSSSSLRSSSRELRTRKEKIAIPGTTSLPPSSPINEQLLNSTNNLYHRKVKYMSNTEWWVGDRCEAKWMADDSDEFPDW